MTWSQLLTSAGVSALTAVLAFLGLRLSRPKVLAEARLADVNADSVLLERYRVEVDRLLRRVDSEVARGADLEARVGALEDEVEDRDERIRLIERTLERFTLLVVAQDERIRELGADPVNGDHRKGLPL